MTIDKSTVPLLPTKDTTKRLEHLPRSIYNTEEGSIIFSLVDALTGDAGVGSLKKQLLISRLNQRLDTTYFSDLDNAFGNLIKLTRLASESYSINPSTDLLSPAEWDEVMIKDAWYRARIKDFFAALALGGTPDGIRLMVKSAIGVDCEVYEMWRFQDYYGQIYGIADTQTLTNFITNPSFETGTQGWSIAVGGTGAALASITTPTGAIQTGSRSLRFSTGTNVTNPTVSTTVANISPAKQYTFSTYYFKPTAGSVVDATVLYTFRNLQGVQIGAIVASPNLTLVDTSRDRISHTFTTPANCYSVQVSIKLNVTVGSTAVLFHLDAVMFSAGTIQPFFDGSTSGYRWNGVANESTSIQTSPIEALSRLKVPSRNEIVIYPHKQVITAGEAHLIRTMTKRLAPVDSVMTVRNAGYAVNKPVPTLLASADSTYFQIDSYITGAVGMQLTETEESNKSYRWLQDGVEVNAPSKAFLNSQEYSQYYLYTDNSEESAIDSVQYVTEDLLGNQAPEQDYKIIEKSVSGWGAWTLFDTADSPDNYPGGKNGRTPRSAPALTLSGQKYVFPYESQRDYSNQMKAFILSAGGQARQYKDITDVERAFTGKILIDGEFTETSYRLPLSVTENVLNSWPARLSIANKKPAKSSTVTVGWYSREANNAESSDRS